MSFETAPFVGKALKLTTPETHVFRPLFQSTQERDKEKRGGEWLANTIKSHQEREEQDGEPQTLRIPTAYDSKGNACPYTPQGCNNSQQEILCIIIKKLKEYMEFKNDPNPTKSFRPLRMTIMGAAGTGKSYLINTITTIARKMFKRNDCIHITGPTGKKLQRPPAKMCHVRN